MRFVIHSQIRNFLLDTLFPISCLSCNKPDVWLCDSCLEKIPLRLEQVCPICEKQITPDGQICSDCLGRRKKPALDALLAASYYEAEIKPSLLRKYRFIVSFQKRELISRVVHCYKYRFIQDLHTPLGKIMLNSLLNSQLPLPDFIVPVPLHKRRLRWRGFNQAELLANYLSENLTPGFEIPVFSNLLVRQKHTRPQMEIKSYWHRKENLKGAFALARQKDKIDKKPLPDTNRGRNLYQMGENLLDKKIVLLVDDIATTGSTLFECAEVLKQNGAKTVFAAVIARQEYKK